MTWKKTIFPPKSRCLEADAAAVGTPTLVTLNLIKAPGAIIEPTIAASIAYIGVENTFRPRADPSWHGGLTFAFGLVRGMGFAGALKELGVGSDGGGVFRPLLFFSLGLKMTQI